ncbi:cadmium-translocating P-type ATPase [Planctomycetales bacterium ZRK34]|nr:cadmium-translocating P-type ATPase [Planctomycetales bacterium ZRK34]
MSEVIQYRVRGLDCSEEVAILQREVGRRDGVMDLEFDVVQGRMSVEFNRDTITPDQIVSAVNATGMKAVPWEQRASASQQSRWQQHGRAVMTATSGLLLASGFVVHWLTHGDLLDALAVKEGPEHAMPTMVMLLYLCAVVTGGWYVFPKAIYAARRLQPDMNLLMVIAVAGAITLGEWFEAATVAFLFALSLLLEHWSVNRARNAIRALMDLTPTTARYICPHDGDIRQKPVEQVPMGATVIVRPGEKIPLDGEVTKGESTVNQAAITGESMPVSKSPGDEVFAGTINEDGAMEFRSTKAADDTTLARIIHMVQEAQSRRAPAQQWVDRFARWYTPAMMLLAVALAVLPPLLGLGAWSLWGYRGLVILVIACPCALVISTPVSIVSALTSAARHGVLVKGGVYMEAAGRLRVLAMDKTGTLTHGQPEVQQVVPLNGHTPEELLERAAALEAHSEHPLARAVLRKAEGQGVSIVAAQSYRAIRGKGGEGEIDGRLFWIGSHRMMHDRGQETPQVHDRAVALEDAGHTVVAIGNDQHVCGLISIADRVREDAPEAVRLLRSAGIRKVVMLTGDNEGTAKAVTAATGVDEYRAQLLPEDKVKAVEALVAEHGHVAMVGDGINDAPALAAASMGIAMGGMGTDAAIETADIALMSDDLLKVSWLIRHSRRTLRNIKTNIAFALGLKFLFIVLAVLGLASLWMAIAADTGATLLVVFNGLRLLRD